MQLDVLKYTDSIHWRDFVYISTIHTSADVAALTPCVRTSNMTHFSEVHKLDGIYKLYMVWWCQPYLETQQNILYFHLPVD